MSSGRILVITCALAAVVTAAGASLGVVASARADSTTAVTIYFDRAAAPGSGLDVPLDPFFARRDGIRFDTDPHGYFLDFRYGEPGHTGSVVGNELHPLLATFTRPVTSILVRFTPGLRGQVGENPQFTLTAYSGSGAVLASRTINATVPTAMPLPQYGTLPAKAKGFSISSTAFEFYVTSITYRYAAEP